MGAGAAGQHRLHHANAKAVPAAAGGHSRARQNVAPRKQGALLVFYPPQDAWCLDPSPTRPGRCNPTTTPEQTTEAGVAGGPAGQGASPVRGQAEAGGAQVVGVAALHVALLELWQGGVCGCVGGWVGGGGAAGRRGPHTLLREDQQAGQAPGQASVVDAQHGTAQHSRRSRLTSNSGSFHSLTKSSNSWRVPPLRSEDEGNKGSVWAACASRPKAPQTMQQAAAAAPPQALPAAAAAAAQNKAAGIARAATAHE